MSRLEPELEDPPSSLPLRVMVVGPQSEATKHRISGMNDGLIELVDASDPRIDEAMRRLDASNSPVDTLPALPPLPEWDRALQAFEPAAKDAERAMAQLAKAWPQPPAGKPGRRRTSSWRIETPEQRADKRAKRKAAEKARRRNRK